MTTTKRKLAKQLLAQRVEDLMKAKGLNATELAKRVGVSQAQISLLLKGKRGASMEVIDRFADLFNVPIASLFEDPADEAHDYHVSDGELTILDAMRAANEKDIRTVKTALGLYDEPVVAPPAAPPISPEAGRQLAEFLNYLAVQSAAPKQPSSSQLEAKPPARAAGVRHPKRRSG